VRGVWALYPNDQKVFGDNAKRRAYPSRDLRLSGAQAEGEAKDKVSGIGETCFQEWETGWAFIGWMVHPTLLHV